MEAPPHEPATPPLTGPALHWLQQDLFDPDALAAAGLGPGSLDGALEHTCFCAIDPGQRLAYIQQLRRLLAPGGWLLGLFWCHGRAGGPPQGASRSIRQRGSLPGSPPGSRL